MGPFSSIRDVIAALRRRAWLILLILLVGLPASVWIALQQPRVFEATAVIQIETPQVTEALAGPMASGLTADSQLDLIQQRMMARDTLVEIIEDFALFPDLPSMTEKVALLREAATIVKLVDPALAWRPDIQPSGLVITVRLGNSEQAAGVANEFLARILDEATRRTEGRAARTLEFFTAEEARVTAEIAAAETALARFQEANAASLPSAVGPQRDQLNRLTETRLTAQRELIALQNASDRLRPEEVARQSEQLSQQIALIDREIATLQTALAAAPEVGRQIAGFERNLTQLQEQFTVITARRTEAAMTQLLETQDQAERFEVLETALPPEFPISASRKKLAVAGGLATGIVAFGLALGLELLGGAIRTPAQLERQLGVKAVVVIPNLHRRSGRRGGLFAGVLAGLLAVIAAVAAVVSGAAQGVIDRITGALRQPAPPGGQSPHGPTAPAPRHRTAPAPAAA